MGLRRRKIKPIPGTPYGVRETRTEHRIFVKRSSITNTPEIDPGGFVRRTEEHVERWDFVAAQPRKDRP